MLHVGRRERPRSAGHYVRRVERHLCRTGRRAAGRRGGHTAHRNGIRHTKRQGGPYGRGRNMRKALGKSADNGVRNAGRRKRPHAVGTDGRGVLLLGGARRPVLNRPQLCVRGQAAQALSGTSGRSGPVPRIGASQRRTAQCHGRVRRNTADVRRRCGSVHARRVGERRRRMLRHHAHAHSRAFVSGAQLLPEAPALAPACYSALGTRSARNHPRGELHKYRRTHQRRRFGQIRPTHPSGRLHGGGGHSPRTSRGGCANHRRVHGRRHDRRSEGHDHVPEHGGLGA